MKKQLISIMLILLSLLTLTACTSAKNRISNIIPYLNTPKSVSVPLTSSPSEYIGGMVYVLADKAQSKKIVELLSAIDMSKFKECERNKVGGVALRFRIEGDSGGCNLMIMVVPDAAVKSNAMTNSPPIHNTAASYLLFRFDYGKTLAFQGPSDAISNFIDLDRASTSVLSDTSDSENTAIVESLDGKKASYPLVKGNSAIVQNILDGTARSTSNYEGKDDYAFDYQITIRKTIYLLDTKTGVFSREKDGQKSVHKLEKNWLRYILDISGLIDGSKKSNNDTEPDSDTLTLYADYKSYGNNFEIGKNIVVATDENFSNKLHMEGFTVDEKSQTYVYKFSLSEPVEKIYIKPPVLYIPTTIESVSTKLNSSNCTLRLNDKDWFSVSSIKTKKVNDETNSVIVTIKPYTDILPHSQFLLINGQKVGGISSLNFNSDNVFDFGEFTFNITKKISEDIDRDLKNSSLIVEDALKKVSATKAVFSSNIKSLNIIVK